ncbi:MAG: hypothetical protein WC794_00270 [Candidatus Doudnabacteria bacterium]
MSAEEAKRHPRKENVVTAIIRGGGETTFRHGLVGKLGSVPAPKQTKPTTKPTPQGQTK